MSETMSLDTRHKDDGGNYITDDDTYPRCVWFANGRMVSIEYTEVKSELIGGDAYLVVERELHPAFAAMTAPAPEPTAAAEPGEAMELPDEPGIWFRHGYGFAVVAVEPNNIVAYQMSRYGIASQFQSAVIEGGWTKAVPATGLAALQDRIASLFPAVAHGDEEHRAWLKQAIDDHFAGRPVAGVKGHGEKEALRAEAERLQSQLLFRERQIRDLDAEHDQTPIDEAWLRSIGFTDIGKHDWPILRAPHEPFDGNASLCHIVRAITRDWMIGREAIHSPSTRGDVRRLCAALAIPLTERTNAQ